MQIEAGKTYLDSNGNYVFIVGKTKEGLWLGQIEHCKYETFTAEGLGLLPNHKLVKEYKAPIVRILNAYLWRNKMNGNISVSNTFRDDPQFELLSSKTVKLIEGEFSGIPTSHSDSTVEND